WEWPRWARHQRRRSPKLAGTDMGPRAIRSSPASQLRPSMAKLGNIIPKSFFYIFPMSADELNAISRVEDRARHGRLDMGISICALTVAWVISCCVAATLMQPKDGRATLGR